MFAVTNRSKAEYKISCIMFLEKVPGKTDGCRYILPQQPPEEFMTKKKTKTITILWLVLFIVSY